MSLDKTLPYQLHLKTQHLDPFVSPHLTPLPIFEFYLTSSLNELPSHLQKDDNTILLTLSTCSGRYSRDAWHLFNEANRILNVIAWYPSHAKLRVFKEVTFELNKITQNLLTEVMGYEQMCNSMKMQLQEAVSQVNEKTRVINEQLNATQGIYCEALNQEYQVQIGKIAKVIKQNEISEQMMKQLETGKSEIGERLHVYWCYTKMGRYGLEEWNDVVYESSL